MNALRSRLADVLLVAGVTAVSAWVSQPWTGFNSPDSEFYASLALFGSEVTDRAIEPAYTWTRLGYIVPVRGLVLGLGPWVGFEIWRTLLIGLIAGAVYSLVRIAGRSRSLGAGLALNVCLNTVLLAFVGNTYLTGTILAATFVLIALAVSQLGSAAHQGIGPLGTPRWTTAAVSGGIAGWLLMINPYGLLLGMGLWLSVRIVVLVRIPHDRWKRLVVDALAGIGGFASVVSAFLLAGRLIFPKLDWWATYVEWNSRLDYTVFVGQASTWDKDSALLVIAVAAIVAAIAVITHPRHRWAWAALAIAWANILITVALMIAMPGPWLEAPTYVAKLWPASLSALVLVFTSASPGTREPKDPHSRLTGLGFLVLAGLLIWSGHFAGELSIPQAWVIAIAMVLASLGALVLTRSRWNAWVAAAVLGAIGMTLVGAQILQNGRGNLGIYGQYPFRSAFVDFDYQNQMASKVELQRWLVSKTSDDDRVALWTDPARLTADVAGMQLWGGYNIFTTEALLNRNTTERLEQIRPSVIAMYAPDRQQIANFYESLPPWALPSDLECTTATYLGVGSGEAVLCLTRLTWVG